jgi:5-methylcytosine-specific restriction endonuclease McrA
VNRKVKVPHPRAPTIDHVVPLSQGGADAPWNVKTAHFMCNSEKGDRTMPDGEQLMLIG